MTGLTVEQSCDRDFARACGTPRQGVLQLELALNRVLRTELLGGGLGRIKLIELITTTIKVYR